MSTVLYKIQTRHYLNYYFKKNLNASRPSEHPPVRGGNVKTFFRWDHSRLHIQKNLPLACSINNNTNVTGLWPSL